MKISIIGLGYVGLVTGICFCEYGHKVICIEKNLKKISDLNKKKEIIFEPGLKNLLNKHLNKNFTVSNNKKNAILNTDISFIAVGTPFKNGKFNTSYLKSVSKDVGLSLKYKKKIPCYCRKKHSIAWDNRYIDKEIY